MFIVQLHNGNFALVESTFNGIHVVVECESYSAAEEMRDRLEGK